MTRGNAFSMLLKLNDQEFEALKDVMDARGIGMSDAIRLALKKEQRAVLKAQVRKAKRDE